MRWCTEEEKLSQAVRSSDVSRGSVLRNLSICLIVRRPVIIPALNHTQIIFFIKI
jgi:hypothetical protein